MGKSCDLRKRAPRYWPAFSAVPPGSATTSTNAQIGQLPTVVGGEPASMGNGGRLALVVALAAQALAP
jgi:hypothetical protein